LKKGALMKTSQQQKSVAFSLIELMLVVGIMGVLATISLPKLQHFQARAKQSEAKINLHHVFTLMETRFIDKNSYLGAVLQPNTNSNWIGWEKPRSKDVRYDYTLTAVTAASWRGEALSKAKLCRDSTAKDLWSIDQDQNLLGQDGC
jgi:prepilin-type N-terminal cleavage/methylation domain-containing protein